MDGELHAGVTSRQRTIHINPVSYLQYIEFGIESGRVVGAAVAAVGQVAAQEGFEEQRRHDEQDQHGGQELEDGHRIPLHRAAMQTRSVLAPRQLARAPVAACLNARLSAKHQKDNAM